MGYEVKPRSIIAMKGLPFTGKTESANLIAASLKCPVFSLDDFLDDLHPHHLQIPSTSPQDLALQIICRISKSHLLRGLVDNIVIDSPLSSRSHLDQLIDLASYIPKTRLIIIECKPNNSYMWQTKFEEYLEANSEDLANKWYKAKDWDEVTKEIKDDYDERLDGYKVSKLVFDPISGFKKELSSRIYFSLLAGQPVLYSPPFMEAISYMITRDESQGPDLVVYDEWLKKSTVAEPEILESGQVFCRGDSHRIAFFTGELGDEDEEDEEEEEEEEDEEDEEEEEEEEEEKVKCTVCEEEVTGAAYYCTICHLLVLHKECVETCSLQPPRITWDKLSSDCGTCKVYKRRNMPHSCPTCEFKRELKRRAYEGVSSVVKHECDEHFLWLDTSSWINIVKCMACGEGEEGNMYSCKICGVVYHGKCLISWAPQVKHVHGGHHHRMSLKFSSPEGEEDYLCQECLEKRDPKLWFYSCEECPYELELRCVLEGIEQDEEESQVKEQEDSHVGQDEVKEQEDSPVGDGESRETIDQRTNCEYGEHIWDREDDEEREYELKCTDCNQEVKGRAYFCKICNIPIHKECVMSYLRSGGR